MKVLGLFSGIGGLELGLERAGMEIVAQSEIDPYASAVFYTHWPDVPNYGDCREVNWNTDGPIGIDLICGGFPCNDISSAHTRNGRGKGLEGEQSGLWYEYLRCIRELSPRIVIVENVASCWRSWLPFVRRDLHGLGYAHLPVQLPAAAFGAPHERPRIFVVAYANGDRQSVDALHAKVAELRPLPDRSGYWGTAPPGGFRVDDGIPHGMDRSRVTGAAVVPQVAEWIGRQIMANEK